VVFHVLVCPGMLCFTKQNLDNVLGSYGGNYNMLPILAIEVFLRLLVELSQQNNMIHLRARILKFLSNTFIVVNPAK